MKPFSTPLEQVEQIIDTAMLSKPPITLIYMMKCYTENILQTRPHSSNTSMKAGSNDILQESLHLGTIERHRHIVTRRGDDHFGIILLAELRLSSRMETCDSARN